MEAQMVELLESNGWSNSHETKSKWSKENAIFDVTLDQVTSLTDGSCIKFTAEKDGIKQRLRVAEKVAKNDFM